MDLFFARAGAVFLNIRALELGNLIASTHFEKKVGWLEKLDLHLRAVEKITAGAETGDVRKRLDRKLSVPGRQQIAMRRRNFILEKCDENSYGGGNNVLIIIDEPARLM
jgi:hypothetical protein